MPRFALGKTVRSECYIITSSFPDTVPCRAWRATQRQRKIGTQNCEAGHAAEPSRPAIKPDPRRLALPLPGRRGCRRRSPCREPHSRIRLWLRTPLRRTAGRTQLRLRRPLRHLPPAPVAAPAAPAAPAPSAPAAGIIRVAGRMHLLVRRHRPAAIPAPPPSEPSIGSADLPEDLVALGHVQGCRHHREGGHHRARLCLARDLDGVARQDFRIAHRAPSESAATCASSTARRPSPRRMSNCATAPPRWRN